MNGQRSQMNFDDCAQLIRETVQPSAEGDGLYIGLEHIGENTLSLVGRGLEREVTSTKTRFRTGDILFGKLRPYFRKVIRAPGDGLCSTDIWVVQAREGVDQGYLYYCMASEQFVEFATAGSEGTRMPRATWEHVIQYPITLPPLPEQRAIAHILGTLDDKIELNRRINQTLEAMARSIFQQWFVDFGPVRAKLGGEERYLPPELWDSFPDELVDSELGDIPEGWEVMPLSKVSRVNPESWSNKNKPATVEYVDLANTKWGMIESTQHFPWKDAPSRARRVLRPGDTLVGTVRPANGSFCFVGNDGLTGSTGFAVLRPSHPRFRELIYLSATSKDNIERLARIAEGAAYPAVRPEIVGETKIPIPTTETKVLAWFSEIVGPILDKIQANKVESRSLGALRDALLPQLISREWEIGVTESYA